MANFVELIAIITASLMFTVRGNYINSVISMSTYTFAVFKTHYLGKYYMSYMLISFLGKCKV